MPTSLESSYYLQSGEAVAFDPMDLVRNAYYPFSDAPDRKEGLYISFGDPDLYGSGDTNILAVMSATPVAGFLLSDLYANYMGDVASTQKMIRELGAVNVSTHYNQGFFPILFHGYKTQNYSGQLTNHVVTLVGWDDGAWLLQNSLSANWGNNGYYWLSYASGVSGCVYVPTDQYRCAQNYGTYAIDILNPADSEAVYAAVYEINGSLGAVGILYGIDETDLSYTVEILDGEFGEALLSFSGTEEMTGYHIAELPEPLAVGTCTFIVHKHKNIPVEGESCDDVTAAVTSIAPGSIKYVATSEPGRCFVLIDDTWVDTISEEIKNIPDLDYIPGDVFLPVLYN